MTASDIIQLVESVNSLEKSVNSVGRDVRRLSRLFEHYVLRPEAGRPRHPKITLATKMHAEGKPWPEIFNSCLPDRALYESAEAYRAARERMKKAVTQRLKRAIN